MNTFDPKTHTYRIDGKPVPSVTQVLSDLLPCWQAGDWYLQRGRAVHACAAMIADGVDFDAPEGIEGQVAALRQFFAEVRPIPVMVERPLYSAVYGYAGSIDLLATIGCELVLIDYKASIGKSLGYQLSAYGSLLYCDLGERIRWGRGVEITERGYRMTERIRLADFASGWFSLLGAYRVRRECGVVE